jgi:hypothetical protein
MKSFITILFFSVLSLNAFAQTKVDLLEKTAIQLTQYTALPQEKVYLSFDKPYYSKGENLYFKGYVVNAMTHAADSFQLSAVLHIEIRKAEKLIEHKQYSINSAGIAYGNFEVNYPSDEYTLTAYTNWMRNQSPDFYFTKRFLVVGNTPSVSTASKSDLRLYFFPEGGSFVAGFENKVAFKATDEKGKGVKLKGVVVEGEDKAMVIFQDEHLGMGSFAFTPQAGKIYNAKVEMPDGTSKNFALPQASNSGFLFSANVLSDEKNIKMRVIMGFPEAQLPPFFYIVGHVRGKFIFGKKIEILNKKDKIYQIDMPREQFEYDGIVHFTLFNDKGLPVAERLVFNENASKRINLTVKPDKKEYAPRERIVLDVATTDFAGKPISAELSLAVLNGSVINTPENGENMMSYMLLSSDVKGYIEQPSFYFENNRKAKRGLDQLLMTQGWRRFDWSVVLDSTKQIPPQYLPELGLEIKGEFVGNKKKTRNGNVLISLLDKNNESQTLYARSDNDSRFTVPNCSFIDSTKLFVSMANNKENFDVKMLENGWKPIDFIKPTVSETSLENIDSYLTFVSKEIESTNMRKEKVTELPEVEVKAKKKEKIDSRSIFTSGAEKIKVDQGVAAVYSNVVEFICGRMGVRCSSDENGNMKFLPLRGFTSLTKENNTVFLLLDGVPCDIISYYGISVRDVERVDLQRSASPMFGARGSNGVINVLTRATNPNRDEEETQTFSNTPNAATKGYEQVKQFYSPDYSYHRDEHDLPDVRTTIYWSPFVKTSERGLTQVVFYNADDVANIKIVAEGTDGKGKIGVAKAEYKVVRK